MPKQRTQIVNNKFRVDYVARQLTHQLKPEFKNQSFTPALLDNLAMLFILRKKQFSYMEFLKNVYIRHEYDEKLDDDGSPQSFVNESILHSAIPFTCIIVGKGVDDFGSISKFAQKNWADEKWRGHLKPGQGHTRIIDRMFHLRNKLISHIDMDLEKVITERDILNLIKLYDGYVVKKVDKIFVKFLGHNQNGSLDFQDMSVRTYVLLFPRETSTSIPSWKRKA
jgi:hypothetical protein